VVGLTYPPVIEKIQRDRVLSATFARVVSLVYADEIDGVK
jgi:hypothetical protein